MDKVKERSFNDFGLLILGCIFTRDGRIILAIRLKNDIEITIYVMEGCKCSTLT
jgi:hypothetical protein